MRDQRLAAEIEHKQTIVLRKDLNMRKGKMVEQGAHASMRAILQLGRQQGESFVIPLDERIAREKSRLLPGVSKGPRPRSTRELVPWLLGRFKRICVSVNSEAELLELHQKAQAAGIITALIQDAGLTEFGGVPTYTAIAVGPDRADRVDSVTGGLPLL